MTKSQLRAARKAARSAGRDWREVDGRQPAHEFTETARGERARARWAQRYDELNGAPESDDDR